MKKLKDKSLYGRTASPESLLSVREPKARRIIIIPVERTEYVGRPAERERRRIDQ